MQCVLRDELKSRGTAGKSLPQITQHHREQPRLLHQTCRDQGPCDSTPVSLLLSALVASPAGHQQCISFIFMAFIPLLLAVPEATQDAIYLEEIHLKHNLMHIP